MGDVPRLPERLEPADEHQFPQLAAAGYRVTSDKDPRYNCIAHVAGETTRKWAPTIIPQPGYYWPPGAPAGDDLEALKRCFEVLGYEACDSGVPESGYEKIALYADATGEWQHAAKLENDGEWSSKLGSIEDIKHSSEHCFRGSVYGEVICYMRRRI